MSSVSAADAELLDSLVEPLWDALLRVRKQARKATTNAEVRELKAARKAIRLKLRSVNDRIEAVLASERNIGALRVGLRRIAGELRDDAARIRGVRSALERAASILRLADKAIGLLT